MNNLNLGFKSVNGDQNEYTFNYGVNCHSIEEGFSDNYDYGYNCSMKNKNNNANKLLSKEEFINLGNGNLNIDLPIWHILLVLSVLSIIYSKKVSKLTKLNTMYVQLISAVLLIISISKLNIINLGF